MKGVQAIQLPIVDSLHPRPDFMPQAIPEDLASRLKTFHGDAPVWWIGQMVKYLMRPNQFTQQQIDKSRDRMKFTGPIVG